MTAAAKCPKCGHLFELRDGFGDAVPLAYCSSCESYYPESLGKCRWCGTTPEHAPIAPLVWRGVGVAAMVVTIGAAWFLRNSGPSGGRMDAAKPAPPRPSADTTALRVAAPTAAPSPATTQRADSAAPRATIARVDSVPAPSTPIVAPQAVARPIAAVATPPNTPPAIAVAPDPRPTPPATSAAARGSTRWVRFVSRDWVVIRSGPSKTSSSSHQ